MTPWRYAASIIMLIKKPPKSVGRPNFNILMEKRSSKIKFVPNAVVFPGGATAEVDSHLAWIDHFKSFGFDHSNFNKFQNPNSPLTQIFLEGNDPIRRHISLRITAIRETFEEVGILICKRRNQIRNNDNIWASSFTDFDIQHWQKQVHDNPKLFLTLCKELDCYPDLWSLHLWNNWLTPIKKEYKSRFDTVFFLLAFENEPATNIDEKEVADVSISEVKDVLSSYDKKEIELIFPQWYELYKLQHQHDIEEIIKFAAARNSFGAELFYPVRQKIKNGLLSLLPGDDLYPSTPDFLSNQKPCDESKTFEELRTSVEKLHRAEFYDDGSKYVRTKNYSPPTFHLSPLGGNIPAINSKNKL